MTVIVWLYDDKWLLMTLLLAMFWVTAHVLLVQQEMAWWVGVVEVANLVSLVPAVRVGLVHFHSHKHPPHSCLVGVS